MTDDLLPGLRAELVAAGHRRRRRVRLLTTTTSLCAAAGLLGFGWGSTASGSSWTSWAITGAVLVAGAVYLVLDHRRERRLE